MNHYDVIIVGAGLGGLTSGALLARQGKRVLILEQHKIVGGCATTFKREDLKIEVGLHEMDGMDAMDPKVALFEYLGLDKRVELIRVPEFYRVVRGDDLDITIPDNVDEALEVLIRHYPEEEKGLRTYFDTITKTRNELLHIPIRPWKLLLQLPVFPLLYPYTVRTTGQTLGHFLDKHIQNEDLKLVLCANLAYYHNEPYTMALDFYSFAQGSYYTGGGYYVKGGSSVFSDALADIIRENGGEIRNRRLVNRILMEKGRVHGVVHTRAKTDGEDEQRDYAPVIISNTAIPRNLEGLLEHEPSREKITKSIKGKKISFPILSTYLGFQGEMEANAGGAYSTFVYPPHARTIKEWNSYAHAPIEDRYFVFVDYSRIDSGLAPEGKSIGVICTPDNINDWPPRKSEEYIEKKARYESILVNRLNEQFPGIKDKMIYTETGTARTVERYTKNPEGTAYGFSQIPGQSVMKRPGPKSPIPGLYYVGAWSIPGHGYTGAITSGFFTAIKIDPDIHRRLSS